LDWVGWQVCVCSGEQGQLDLRSVEFGLGYVSHVRGELSPSACVVYATSSSVAWCDSSFVPAQARQSHTTQLPQDLFVRAGQLGRCVMLFVSMYSAVRFGLLRNLLAMSPYCAALARQTSHDHASSRWPWLLRAAATGPSALLQSAWCYAWNSGRWRTVGA
jgi:hypothetical protein